MLKEKYTPLYFLASLGAGGLSVSFFMYLMFFIPHKGVPLTTFDFAYPALLKGNWLSFVTAFSMVFIIGFAYLHFKLLIWNVKQYNLFKATNDFKILKNSNNEVILMALPLTFAMTINVCFVLGALFVPRLWTVVEYLFPMALIGFATVGYYALKIFFNYFNRLLITGDFDFTKNNNLSQMLSIFAFVMIGVGFAAPGAMSHYIQINAIGIFGAIFFSSIAILLIVLKLILGFKSMFKHGVNIEASPSLWIMIPILTLLGITFIRVAFGLGHHFEHEMIKSSIFTISSVIVSLQILFGVIGYKLMKSLGYFDKFIYEDKKSPVSLTLICPGVAFMVFGIFFINYGLVFNSVVVKYSITYFAFYIPLVFIQYKTIIYFFKLKNRFSL
jgi:hypothetical protein